MLLIEINDETIRKYISKKTIEFYKIQKSNNNYKFQFLKKYVLILIS